MKNKRVINEENIKKEKEENSSINIQEKTNERIEQYKHIFFLSLDNNKIKQGFEEEIKKTIDFKKQRDLSKDGKVNEKINKIKADMIDYLQDPDLFSYCSREALNNPQALASQKRIKFQAIKII